MLGFNVFSSFNAVYQLRNANVVYSNYLEYHKDVNQILKGSSYPYDTKKIEQYEFRTNPIQFGPMMTFKRHLFNYISSDRVMFTREHGSAL